MNRNGITLSIIIVNWNTRNLLVSCLHSLRLAAHPDWEAIVVDNASTDDSVVVVQANFPTVHLIVNSTNSGFGAANNQGIRACRGAFVLLLNSDTEMRSGALETLLAFMTAHPDAGAVGPRLLRLDGSAQPFAFGNDPTLRYLLARGANALLRKRPLHNWATPDIQRVDWVSGACMLVRRAAIEEVGLLDEKIFMYFEDNDWCLRFRKAGWNVYYCPQAEILHLGGQSMKKSPTAQVTYHESLCYFYQKHYSRAAQWALRLILPIYRTLI